MNDWVGKRLLWVEPAASSIAARFNSANGIWNLNDINDYITDSVWPNINDISPLHLANGFLSLLNKDTVNPGDFPNAVIGNGYISVLRIGDTVNPGDFPNAVVGNGYIGVLYSDII